PVMWLGMISAAAGQLPGLPTEPINALNSVLIGYIAQIAAWAGRPDWALLRTPTPTLPAVAAIYAAMGTVGLLAARQRTRRGDLRVRAPGPALAIALLLVALPLATVALRAGPAANAPASGQLIVSVLDVGQGDAILLDPPGGDPVLVDTGPPGSNVAGHLRRRGVERLAAVAVTHDQLDHSGGLRDVLGRIEVGAVAVIDSDSDAAAMAQADSVPTERIARGSSIRTGQLELRAIWPPADLAVDEADPNRSSMVLAARWRHFSMLLAGDAEAEATQLDPGRFDVLKVAHHGSTDAGLPRLLARSAPAVAVISVGAMNTHGHPTAETRRDLSAAGVHSLRTDEHGDVTFFVDSRGWRVRTERSR
ncbi:MAG: ComEC/Rec2 family competence protein, partial [Solirubrobacterales bacterium]